LDGDGSINLSPEGIIISASNNLHFVKDDLMNIYGGNIYISNTTGRSFKWQINKKTDILSIINYFKVCPSYSAKMNRIRIINNYFELRKIKAHLASKDSIKGKLWEIFIKKWKKWE
jgi:hypothetical protein